MKDQNNNGKKLVITKKTITVNGKKLTKLEKKLIPVDQKLVPVNKKIVQVAKKIKPSDKKIVSMEAKKIVSNKKIIPPNGKNISTDFQFKIFQAINNSNIGENIMVSPLSIYHILSLTANGAANNTLLEMLKSLSENDLNDLNKNNKIISSSISNLKSVELANAVYTRFKPLENFLAIIKEYKAKLDELKDAEQVNKWCSDATHGKIPKIIDNISGADKMVLINAIYFKGKWQKPFEKKDTKLDTFLNFNKEPKKIYFMNSTKKFDYFEDDNVQAVSLSYDKDNIKALIILPKNNEDKTIILVLLHQKYIILLKVN